MAKILLAQPIEHELSQGYQEHIGLSYISSDLKRAGHEVFLFDKNINRGDYLRLCKEGYAPDFVGVTSAIFKLEEVSAFCERTRKSFQGVPIIVGGPAATAYPREILEKTGADFIIRGEGTGTLRRFISGERDISGLVHLGSTGELIGGGLAPYAPDDWHLDPESFSGRGYAQNVVSSVGCNYGRCTFCNVSTAFPHLQERNIDSVIADILILREKKGISVVNFGDDNFLYRPDRAAQIISAMDKAGLDLQISFQTRTDSISRAIDSLKQYAGRIHEVQIGIESMLDEQLKRWNKGVTAKQNREAIESLRKAGIRPYPNFILFDKETDLAELRKVSDVFVKNPEYLFLTPMAQKMTHDFPNITEYPFNFELYYLMFEVLVHTLRPHYRPDVAERGFLRGKNQSRAGRKIVKEVFADLHKLVEDESINSAPDERKKKAEETVIEIAKDLAAVSAHLYPL